MVLSFDLTSWAWPQYTVLSVYLLGIVMHAALHGTKTDKQWNVIFKLIEVFLAGAVLAAGGFWN
jgi:hypothetical protein